ncbi:MAG: AAA family ATPase [Clostridiales bacterium]|nr:AAA family ATPase [Clostridiales bacterium]
MIFLRAIKQTEHEPSDSYPLNLPQIAAIDRLEFSAPVTLIAGDNGSGKTTLVELIAALTGAVRIGDARASRRAQGSFSTASRAFRAEFTHKPKRSFFFLAEDFTRYIDAREDMMREERAEMERIDREYANRSGYARSLAAMPHASGLHEMNSMYSDELAEQSHGEGYIDFFGARLKPQGLYLMDEPEGALSYYNQYVLMNMIADAAKHDSQFIVSTHSPVLLAYPCAMLYAFDSGALKESSFEQLENINFLRDFLSEPGRYLRRLGEAEE